MTRRATPQAPNQQSSTCDQAPSMPSQTAPHIFFLEERVRTNWGSSARRRCHVAGAAVKKLLTTSQNCDNFGVQMQLDCARPMSAEFFYSDGVGGSGSLLLANNNSLLWYWPRDGVIAMTIVVNAPVRLTQQTLRVWQCPASICRVDLETDGKINGDNTMHTG